MVPRARLELGSNGGAADALLSKVVGTIFWTQQRLLAEGGKADPTIRLNPGWQLLDADHPRNMESFARCFTHKRLILLAQQAKYRHSASQLQRTERLDENCHYSFFAG